MEVVTPPSTIPLALTCPEVWWKWDHTGRGSSHVEQSNCDSSKMWQLRVPPLCVWPSSVNWSSSKANYPCQRSRGWQLELSGWWKVGMFQIQSKIILAVISSLSSQLLATSLVDLATFSYGVKLLGCSDLADHRLHCPQNFESHQIASETSNTDISLCCNPPMCSQNALTCDFLLQL